MSKKTQKPRKNESAAARPEPVKEKAPVRPPEPVPEKEAVRPEPVQEKGIGRAEQPVYPGYPPQGYGYGAGYGYPYGGVYGSGDEWPSEGGLDIRALIGMLWRKKITLVLTTCFALIVAVFYLTRATRIYESESIIELSLRRPRIMSQQDAVIDEPGRISAAEIFNTQLMELKIPAMHDAAEEEVRRSMSELEMPDKTTLERLRDAVDIELIRRSSLVRITAENPDPVVAAATANAYAEVAVESTFNLNKEMSDNAVAWLDAQALLQRKALEKVEDALLKFREEHQMDALAAQRKTAEQALLAYNDELIKLESRGAETQDMLDMLNSLSLNYKDAGKLPSSIPRATEITLRLEELTAATAVRDGLLARYKEKHPEVEVQNRTIEAAQRQLENEIARARENSASDLALLRKQAESLREQKESQNALASELERTIARCKAKLNGLEREKEACDISYKGILHRMEEARLSADENTATIKVIQPAEVPEKPVKPRKLIVLFLALFLGGGGGVGLALLTSTLEDKVWNAVDVEQAIGLKILGLVPQMGEVGRKDLAIMSSLDKFSIVAEAFAGIRGMLDLTDDGKTFLVTSSAPGEGKTICGCNLAIMSAKSGIKTLLVDLDWRRSRLDSIWETNGSHPGILDVLTTQDDADFGKCLQPTQIPNLSIIVARHVAQASPAEFLGSARTKEFLKWAGSSFDRVILDSPPVGIASDAMVLGGMVDGVILVCRFNRSKKKAVKFAVRRLTDYKANILGIIVNDVKLTATGYYGSFGEYYSSGDYGDKGKKEKKLSNH